VNDQVQTLMDKARRTAGSLIKDTESCLFQTDIYGSRFIKEVAQCSPDAYVQLAMQLAYWRLYKEVTPVYESASIRLFKHGRTETGRSMSSESLEFIQSFDNDDILYDTKRQLFRKAIATQSGYMKDASNGKGIDRHMLGLRCMIKPVELEKATMFTDPSYTKTMYFKLSTSNMSPGTYFYGGFGPVVPEGYGINYAIGRDDLKFSISTKKSCPATNSFKFRETLERTLIDLFILFLIDIGAKYGEKTGRRNKYKNVKKSIG
jgi:carnitine O-acetyltransferase